MQADEFKAVRTALGWTQQQMAEGLGISRKAIVEMEGGKAPIERRTELAVHYLELIDREAGPEIIQVPRMKLGAQGDA